MQKKSLLVALFCGALCLTGCLKNEESPSVARVRNEKANELNSIAELNKAQAQAVVIYANAEATLKNAQAELEKANAALVLAQAETEKVRAQLLSVQVKLAEVKVEEEKVTLRMMEANLESRLAYLEAEKAAAEAAKQAWANVLNDLLAQAEVNAIKNAQSILEAEEALQDYVLSKAGEKVDSAKYYAGLYFATLKEIEKLQVQELEAKAARVLVNQGAILTREYIYDEIEATNDTIAQNEAIIKALKESQSKTPEEAEEALKEARKTLNEAYTAYRLAKEAEGKAKDAFDAEWTKTSDFQKKWDSFKGGVASLMPHGSSVRPFDNGRMAPAVLVDDAIVGVPVSKLIKESYGFVWNHMNVVEIDGVSVTVPTAGINVRTEEGMEFIPFWNAEVTDTTHTRYPDVDVYQKTHSDHLHLSDVVIAPATIYYDNIQAALDSAVAHAKVRAKNNIARKERQMNRQIAHLEEEIEGYEDSIALHQAYVDARSAAVQEAEDAYITAYAAAKASKNAIGEAWDAFQQHMLLKHPTVDRKLFEFHYLYDTLHRYAVSDTVDALEKLEGVQEGLDDNKAAVKTAFEAMFVAQGVVKKATDSLENEGEKATAAQKAAQDYKDACADWDPNFANVATDENVKHYGTDTRDDQGYWKIQNELSWYVPAQNEDDAVEAGKTQDSTLTAKHNQKLAEQNVYKAQRDVDANVDGAAARLADANAAYTKWTAKVASAQGNEDAAWIIFYDAYSAYYDALGFFPEHMYDAFNPAVNVLAIATFPTDAGYGVEDVYKIKDTTGFYNNTNPYYNTETGKWVYQGQPAGSAQAKLLDAVLVVYLQQGAIKEAKGDLNEAKTFEAQAQGLLTTADVNLIAAIKGVDPSKVDPKKDKIEDYLDEDDMALFEAYLESYKNVKDADEAWAALKKAYAPYPNEVGALDFPNPFRNRFHNFGWFISNYNVDYKAKYIGKDAKEHSIARFLNGRRHGNPYKRSLQYKAEQAQEKIDVTLPGELEEYTKTQNGNVEALKETAAAVMVKVNAFKTYEAGYQNWVKERDAAEEAYIAAQIATYDAKAKFKAAQAKYDAADAVVNEGVFVYDPKSEVYARFQEVGATHDWRGFTLVPVANAIELLEEENEELEAKNEFLRNVLHDGKKVLSVVNEIIDQKIAVISDNIQIMTAIAAEYRLIMNAYLGIDDEEEVEGETTPLDGEGDDEE